MTRTKNTLNFNYEQLDPGVRRLVRWLHERGFNTTDSGDGVTKFKHRDELRERVLSGDSLAATAAELDDAIEACNCAIEAPNVIMTMPRSRLVSTADDLKEELAKIGVRIAPMSPDGSDNPPSIQASYDPADGEALILLLNVDDSMLPEWAGKAAS